MKDKTKNILAIAASSLMFAGSVFLTYSSPVQDYFTRMECKKYGYINDFPKEERKMLATEEYYNSPISFWGVKPWGMHFDTGKKLFVRGVLDGLEKCSCMDNQK